jgi:hypothetical protein
MPWRVARAFWAVLIFTAPWVSSSDAFAQLGSPADPKQTLIGTWQGALQDRSATYQITSKLDRDGTYLTQQGLAAGVTITMRGRWSAQFLVVSPGLSGSKGLITTEPTDWQPREFCAASGICQPVVVNTQSIPFTIIDPNALEVGDGSASSLRGTLRRIQ